MRRHPSAPGVSVKGPRDDSPVTAEGPGARRPRGRSPGSRSPDGMSPHHCCVDWRPGTAPCFWGVRAAHSPALILVPRAHRRPRRCGPSSGPGRPDTPRWGSEAEGGGATEKPRNLQQLWTGKVLQPSSERHQAPPRPLRPHVLPPRRGVCRDL